MATYVLVGGAWLGAGVGSLSRAQPTGSPSVSPSSSTWTADRSPTASPTSTLSRPKSGSMPSEK